MNNPGLQLEVRELSMREERDPRLETLPFYLRETLLLVLFGALVVGPHSLWAADVGSVKMREASGAAVDALRVHLAVAKADRSPLNDQSFATVPLTEQDSERARELLWKDHVASFREARSGEMRARELSDGDLKMPFFYKVFGKEPKGGRSLFISMHGGGGAPVRVNDQQWENQKRLYELEEGVYLAPRAPTNTWNLWHQSHIDRLFDRLIQNLIVFENVDPDRVYIMGYSAGGDGVFQLAPRMADRLGAAAMMAGHPNETSPLGLRNLPFTLHMGGKDSAYKRNEIARQWETKLAELHRVDPEGYVHWVKIYPEKGHWMDREDAAAIGWMAKYERNRLPDRIVWKQDDVRHARFYWLAVNPEEVDARAEVIASREGATFVVEATGVNELTVLLNDQMFHLDQPVTISSKGKTLYVGPVARTVKVIARTLTQRGDPKDVFCSDVTVTLPE